MLARVTPNTVSLAALNAPPDPSAGLWLDDHVALFEEKWQELERRFFKLETLQFYDESGVPAFEAWKRGDIEEVRRLAATEARVQAEDPVEQRTQSVRVRILGVPVSDYVRWENEIYRAWRRPVKSFWVSKRPEFRPNSWVNSPTSNSSMNGAFSSVTTTTTGPIVERGTWTIRRSSRRTRGSLMLSSRPQNPSSNWSSVTSKGVRQSQVKRLHL